MKLAIGQWQVTSKLDDGRARTVVLNMPGQSLFDLPSSIRVNVSPSAFEELSVGDVYELVFEPAER